MKKPKVKEGDYWTQTIEVYTNDGDILMPFEVADAYDGMIDVLLDCHNYISNKMKFENPNKKSKLQEKIEDKLKRAGVTDL